ncbi:MAG: endo-1,4-beta-xylanase [Planctomycetota bacterium]
MLHIPFLAFALMFAPPVDGGTRLADLSADELIPVLGADASAEVEGDVLRITVPTVGQNAWDTQVTSPPIDGTVAKDEYVYFTFRARAVSAQNEQQEGLLSSARFQDREPNWESAGDTSARLTSAWRTFHVVGVALRPYEPGTAELTFHLAAQAQVIELADVEVWKYPAGFDVSQLPVNEVDYPGREADAAWRAVAAASIEAHRKADMRVTVTQDGVPVEDAQVTVAMTKHAFHFGSFLGGQFLLDTPDRERMRASFEENFNYATTPVYWADWGWELPESQRNYKAQIEWLGERGIPYRAHNIIWSSSTYLPRDVFAITDPNELRALSEAQVREVVGFAAPHGVTDYDVINEPRVNQVIEERCGPDIVGDWYRIAEELDPEARMFVNDYGIVNNGGIQQANIDFYTQWITTALEKGWPVEGIGIQGHFGEGLTDPARVREILDEFAEFDLPIHITEFDIETYNEKAQADYTRDFLTVCFSHPSVDAFILWGWWAGDHWKPAGAMLREDWTPKPNYHVWRDLVYNQWWTDETTSTNADGVAEIRGFKGTYLVTVTVDGKSIEKEVDMVDDVNVVIDLLATE